ncbi:MAG: type IIL restriction-modification enzyme MmeI [Verrucomicrobiia bacterium]
MTAQDFIAKWSQVDLTERSAAQQHFLDLCELVGHPKPAAADPTGVSFTFEKGASKHGGGDGWADVWKKDFFGWEYKGKKKNLDAAYDQLLQYRADLENPPLLVVCDIDIIRVHTNFNNAPTRTHEITLASLDQPRNLEILRHVFFAPDQLRPGVTSEAITEKASGHFAEIAEAMRQRGLDPQAVAHFLVRVVFCLFAEDVGLLQRGLFTKLVTAVGNDPKKFARHVGELFSAMSTGGDFLLEPIRHFNGSLFDAGAVLELTTKEIAAIGTAAGEDWSAVDVTISGTLFERGLNPAKRTQQGAHYTGRLDIETIVEPVVLAPLRREWADVRAKVEKLLTVEPGRSRGNEAQPGTPAENQHATPHVVSCKTTRKSRATAEKLVLALPKSIRDELGHRIEDGEQGKELVKWLNGLSGVQRVLKEQFGERPITEQNLSEWKQTGHPEWLRHQKACEKLRWLTERTDDLENEADGMEISDRLGSILAAELASLVEKLLEENTDPKERWRLVQEVLREFRYFRHEGNNSQRNQLQRQRWEREVERQDEEDLKREEKERKSRQTGACFSPMINHAVAECFGGGEHGKKMAELLHRINFDLPFDDLIDSELPGKTHPNGIQPNPTESDLIQPKNARPRRFRLNHPRPPTHKRYKPLFHVRRAEISIPFPPCYRPNHGGAKPCSCLVRRCSRL